MTEEKKAGRPAKVKCVVVRKIGVVDKDAPGGVRMCEPNEQVSLSRADAKKLQDSGAIKVAI